MAHLAIIHAPPTGKSPSEPLIHMTSEAESTEKKFVGFVKDNKWVFAKSMPSMPHSYIVKNNCTSSRVFEEFVSHIREAGAKRMFRGKEYTYLDFVGFSFWTMGAPIGETIIINRVAL